MWFFYLFYGIIQDMNQAGKDYVDTINKLFSQHPKRMSYVPPNHTKIQERVMRLGVEAKMYELETPGLGNYTITQDLEDIARAILKEDFMR